MKTFSAALAVVLVACGVGASAAHAVKPKTGTWKVQLVGAQKPAGYQGGSLLVSKKKGKLVVTGFQSPDHYTRCTGPQAQQTEINPGFKDKWGLGLDVKLGKKATFARRGISKFSGNARVQEVSGKFTSKSKASGTLRVRISEPERRACDSGTLKWKATK